MVNNKNTVALVNIFRHIFNFEHNHFSIVSIVDFEQVNVDLVMYISSFCFHPVFLPVVWLLAI